MVRWLAILVWTLRSTVRTQRELALENLALRQQVAVWKVRQPRPQLTATDRIFWVVLSRLWKNWRFSLQVVRPETVVRWHRQGFRRYLAWKSRRRRGRPAIETELRDLIRRMSRANPLWGAPRIHGELLKLGLTVSQATVSKYLVRPRRPPSQAWRTFLKNHAKDGRVEFPHGAHGDLSGPVRACGAQPRPAAAGAHAPRATADLDVAGSPAASCAGSTVGGRSPQCSRKANGRNRGDGS